jgi:leucine-zipper-like transcriptional regulator 1
MNIWIDILSVKKGIILILISIVCISAVNASIIGEKWSPVTGNASWSPRYDHTALAFDNKMWVLGGTGGSDVWYSADGIAWIKATDSAGWLPRSGHSSVEYMGKMWVLGGGSETNLKNDVWYSADGITWVQATGNANWSPRWGHSALVFDNKIWVIGGDAEAPKSPLRVEYKNDVWYSTDGSTWVQATGNANWSPRWGQSALVFDNKMWVIGGAGIDDKKYSTYYNDTWYSTDGSTWIQATGTANWLPRSEHQSVVFGQRMWVLGGYIGLKSISGRQEVAANDAWYSFDGKIWYPASRDSDWSQRSGHQVIEFNNRMWILGGKEPGNPQNRGFDLGPGYPQYQRSFNTLKNDVWKSDSVIVNPTSVPSTQPHPTEKLTQPAPLSYITLCASLIFSVFVLRYLWQKKLR